MSSQSSSLKKAGELSVGDQERDHDLVQPRWRNAALCIDRAEALLDRVADDAVDLGLGVDLVVGDSPS